MSSTQDIFYDFFLSVTNTFHIVLVFQILNECFMVKQQENIGKAFKVTSFFVKRLLVFILCCKSNECTLVLNLFRPIISISNFMYLYIYIYIRRGGAECGRGGVVGDV